MKTIFASAAAVSLLASASFAGSLVAPDVAPMVEVMEDDSGSSGGLMVPLLLLAAIAALAASSSSSGT